MAAATPVPQIEPEPAEWRVRGMWVAARLLCGATAFFFLCFVFAYFYLRSLNTNGRWKIGPVHPSMTFGVVIAVVLVVSAAVMRVAARRPRTAIQATAVTLVLGLVAVVLQCVEYTTLGFGPASGGYASVFVGWTLLYSVAVLCTMYWVETQCASLWRARRSRPYEEELTVAGLHACSFYWTFLVGIGVVAWLVLYVV